MKNLFTRSLTGLIYLLVFTGSLFFGKYTFGLLFLTISLLALREFYQITEILGFHPARLMGIITGAALFILTFYVFAFEKSPILCLLTLPLLIITIISELYRKSLNPLADLSLTILGIVYVSIPIALFNYFAFYNHQGYTAQIVLGFFILLWTNDTAAYLFGISFGKHRLFERISPKKSWEGFVGGTVTTLILAYFLNLPFKLLDRTDWMVIGLIISVAGVYGDLVESMFKRSANIKDSGKILPGHGGILDRIDSVLLSSPLVFVYLIIQTL